MKHPTMNRVSTLAVAAALATGLPGIMHGSALSRSSQEFRRPQAMGGLSKSSLTPSQVRALATDANKRVIVILNNQFTMMANPSRVALASRSQAIRSSEDPILTELRDVQAHHVLPFTIINGIRATVSSAEESRLQANPAVRAVVPDAIIKMPTVPLESDGPTGAQAHSARPATTCATTTPELAPEALSLTNTAFDNSATPQAQTLADGSGIKVAFMADGVDPLNADFRRSDGSAVIADTKDFTGEGFSAASDGVEAFGDASSIAAQGKSSFLINNYLVKPNSAGCQNIRILGMAPGASLMALKVFGQSGGATSNFVQAIQYAVGHGANILSQSFGSNPFPDNDDDPTALADAAAIKDGVTVVASTGDGGTANNLGSPSTVPGVISVGASTQLLGYKQTNSYGFQLSSGSYTSDNISSISSGGMSQLGLKTPDVVAPGDLGWALCSVKSTEFTGCLNYANKPTGFQLFGGTSESAPLVSGEAALVIEAYKGAHGGKAPSPAIVKQIIMSTATNLGEPSYEQGAGLVNSLNAVQTARAYGKSGAHPGDGVVTTATAQSASGLAGARETFHITAQNAGSASETIRPKIQKLGMPASSHNFSVALSQSSDPTFTDEVGIPRSYATKKFVVPSGADRLDASIAWNVLKKKFSVVRLTLLDPAGAYTAYTLPQDNGTPLTTSGFGHVDVRNPAAGTWKAIIWTKKNSAATGFTGQVQLSEWTSKWVKAGTVTPTERMLSPGESGSFTVTTKLPSLAGDQNENINFGDAAGAIPVVLRTKIRTNSKGGSFAGSLTGTNGRAGAPETMTYLFKVPDKVPSLGLGIKVPGTGYNLQATLIDPSGTPVDTQASISNTNSNKYDPGYGLPTAYRNTIQLFWKNPVPGTWRILFILDGNISGASTTTAFTGKISFANQPVKGHNVPNSSSTVLKKGKKRTVTLTIKNTGNTVEQYFVDPRLTTKQAVKLQVSVQGTGNLSGPPWPETFVFVPPQSSSASVSAEATTASTPVQMDCADDNGSPPAGFLGTPDIEGTPGKDHTNGHKAVTVTLKASHAKNAQVVHGFMLCFPTKVGPFPTSGAASSTFKMGAQATTKPLIAGLPPAQAI